MMKHRTRDSGANKIVGARVFKFGTDRTEFPRKSYGPWSNNSRKKERKLTNAEVMSKKMKQSMGTRQQAPDSVDQQ
jgi:hypothetical protein